MRSSPLLDVTPSPYPSYRQDGDWRGEVVASGKTMYLLFRYLQHGSDLSRPHDVHIDGR